MTAECRPPEGTPDGAVFWMQKNGVRFRAMWRAPYGDWVSQNGYYATPEEAAALGWSLATQPQEPR